MRKFFKYLLYLFFGILSLIGIAIIVFLAIGVFKGIKKNKQENTIVQSEEISPKENSKINRSEHENNFFNRHNADYSDLRKLVHKDLKDFNQPIIYFQTKKFKVLVDNMFDSENNLNFYRYSSWSNSKSISEKPDLILYSGDYTFEGRNYSTDEESYFFKNHDYYYQVLLYNSESETIGYDAKLSVWKGKPYVNENIIVEQNGQIISPFSKVLAAKNVYNLINHLPSSDVLLYDYQINEEIESFPYFLFVEDEATNISVLEILQNISGLEIFPGCCNKYPKWGNFDFNEDFLNWVYYNLIPEEGIIFDNINEIYSNNYSHILRTFALSYWEIDNKLGIVEETNKFTGPTDEEDLDLWRMCHSHPNCYLYNNFGFDSLVYYGKTYNSNPIYAGMWMRRQMEGSASEWYRILDKILRNYDFKWFEKANPTEFYNFNFKSRYSKKKVRLFYENGFNLIDYNFESTMDQDNDSDQHPYEEEKFHLEQFSPERALELFNLYTDNKIKDKIPSLTDSLWINFPVDSVLTIGNPYTGENVWNTSFMMSKDSNNKLNNVLFNFRGMGGGYDITVNIYDNYCELIDHSFAD